ncbi:hypothetical protein ACJQWK_11374 [Exserohilum turcicum]
MQLWPTRPSFHGITRPSTPSTSHTAHYSGIPQTQTILISSSNDDPTHPPPLFFFFFFFSPRLHSFFPPPPPPPEYNDDNTSLQVYPSTRASTRTAGATAATAAPITHIQALARFCK